MSAASLLKVYDGQDPELAFTTAGPGATPNLAAVLGAGAAAGNIAMTALGDLTFGTGDAITGPTTALLTLAGGAGQGVSVVGPVGASLIATTGGCKVEAVAGVLELNYDGVGGELNIVPLGTTFTDITSTAAGAKIPNYSGATKQLQIQVGGVDYYIALNPVAFT
jgi:hypothetical protein